MINQSILAVIFVLAAVPAFAQFDARWNPYLGCWRIVQEHQGDQQVPIAPGLVVCAQPSGRAGVSVTTSIDGKNVLEQTIVADGSTQPVAQADCRGTQSSNWSRDGERLFTRVEIECSGRPTRVISGITQISKGYWIDAQATVVDGDHDVRLRRYQRTSDPYGSAAAPSGAPMNVEDVIEASARVLSPALEAALVESGGRFSLDSRTLKQLADNGVSPNVIDVMVAQAYPDRFEIERPSTYPPAYAGSGGTMSGPAGTATIVGSTVYPSPMYDPFYNSYSYYYYSPFAYPYYWGSSYDPYRYNYGYRNYNNSYYYGYPRGYAPPNHPNSGGPARPGSPNSPGGDGVVVNGRGYTRVRPAGSAGSSGERAEPAERTTSPGRRARSVSGSEGSSSGSSSSGSSSSSGDSSSSGGGSSSGGSSGGRTAQPR